MRAALETLADGAKAILGRSLGDAEIASFSKYLDLLHQWQQVHRLVGSSEAGWLVEHLFLDSLLFLRVLPDQVRALADVGSGAGFPGIPLKIVRPEWDIVLVEARQRRISFLSAAIRELGLAGIRVVGRRLQDAPELSGVFDAVVMRCAGDVGALFPDIARLLRPGGVIVASGPPSRRPLTVGRWVEVPGVRSGATRRFAVYSN